MPRSLKEVNRSGFLRQQKGGDKTFTFTYTRMKRYPSKTRSYSEVATIICKVPKETVRWGITIVQSEASILHYAKPVLCAAEHIHRL
jgi:hypothetical protein